MIQNGILYLGYARRSEEDKNRQVASIPDQLDIISRLAKERFHVSLPDENIFIDSKSAKFPGLRPHFSTMLAQIEQTLKTGTKVRVICWHASRLARNGTEGGALEDLVRWKGLEIYTDVSGDFLDGSENHLHNEFGSSAKHSKDTSLGVKRNMKWKLDHGICPTATHLGYMYDPTKLKGLKDHVKRPTNWNRLREWIELMLTGDYTVEQSLNIMTARGLVGNHGQPISRSVAYQFFRDIFNTGMFRFHGEQFLGIHPPLLSMQEYNRIQQLILNRGSKGADLRPLPHTGVFRCLNCGCSITAGRHLRRYLNGKNQMFAYYFCTRKRGHCQEKAVPSAEMERQIQSYIDEVEIVPEFVGWLKKVMKRQNQIEYQRARTEQRLQTNRLAEITHAKFQLRAMKDEGFFPDESAYQQKKTELLMQEQLVKQEIVTTDDSVFDALFEDTLNFATQVRELYESDDPLVKRLVVEIIGLNFKLGDKKLKIEAKNAFIAMHRIKKDLYDKNLWIEPEDRLTEQPNQATSEPSVLLCADDRTRLEPFRLNYRLFFPNLEEAKLLKSQLDQLHQLVYFAC